MKTIGDFKAAGLTIIKGDLIDGITRDKASVAWIIRSFAWREATHEIPEFKGRIEVTFKLGDTATLNTNVIDASAWSLITQWRPLVDQPNINIETPEEKAELDRLFGKVSVEDNSRKTTLDEFKESCLNLQKPQPKPDQIKNPKHYQILDGVESIEIIACSLTLEGWKGFCLGNILKYRIRAGKKDKLEQDIGKAEFYEELYEKHKHLCMDA